MLLFLFEGNDSCSTVYMCVFFSVIVLVGLTGATMVSSA